MPVCHDQIKYTLLFFPYSVASPIVHFLEYYLQIHTVLKLKYGGSKYFCWWALFWILGLPVSLPVCNTGQERLIRTRLIRSSA